MKYCSVCNKEDDNFSYIFDTCSRPCVYKYIAVMIKNNEIKDLEEKVFPGSNFGSRDDLKKGEMAYYFIHDSGFPRKVYINKNTIDQLIHEENFNIKIDEILND